MITLEVWTVILLYCYPADNALSTPCRKAVVACYKHEHDITITADSAITKCISKGTGL